MKSALLIALVIVSSAIVSAEPVCRRVHRISEFSSKPQRKVISRTDPEFGHLIGRSKSEVFKCQGEPAEMKPDAWIYHESLGPGAYSFLHSWIVKFKRDKVVEVEVIQKAIGCIHIPPPRDWQSKP